jgi:hypothetical protein
MVKQLNERQMYYTRAALICVVLLVAVVAGSLLPIPEVHGIDFPTFYHAGQLISELRSPYEETGFHNPLWVALLLAPLSIFPEQIAHRVFIVISIMSYLFVFLRLGGRNRSVLIFAFASAMVWYSILYGTLDFLVLLALFVPAELGIWLALSKPQIGLVLAALLFWKIYERRGAKVALIQLALVGMAVLASFLSGMQLTNVNMAANSALWPFALLVGIPLVIRALVRRDEALALVAATLSAPYISFGSWSATLPAATRRPWVMPLLAIASWIVWVYVLRRLI